MRTLLNPDRPVVAFTGDGGFLMTVFDDREIGLIRVKQEIKGIAAHGVQLGGIDWEKLVQSFGADGVTVETEQAVANALQAGIRDESQVRTCPGGSQSASSSSGAASVLAR